MKGLPSHPNRRLRHRRMPPGVPGPHRWYRLCRRTLQITFAALWGVRVFNRHVEPSSGSALYVCNHQSYLDPVLMSLALRRPMNYMARDSLFRAPVFRQLILSLNAFPVRRAQADTSAVKQALRLLNGGGQLVVFAEGTRTFDGRIAPLLPLVGMLAQRSADWTVPVVIDGAFECWPRTQPLPLPGHIAVCYGRPVPRDQAATFEPRQFVHEIRRRLVDIQTDLRRRLGRPPLTYPADLAQGGPETP